ncbi:MAG: Holliday junction resolvase [Dehalococcoidia bacterium]|nr:Holliday junction resolvase [Dehalococcoidia bacterium]
MELFLFGILATIVMLAAMCMFYVILRWRFSRRFQEWQISEHQLLEAERESIRKSAVTQSRSVLGGKFTEQIAPYLPDFKYDPTEARFIGTPFDLIVFPGLAIGDPQEIVIMEIKTGKSTLSSSERKIRQLIEDGMVRYELLQPKINAACNDATDGLSEIP